MPTQAQQHENISNDFLSSTAKQLQETFRHQVTAPLIWFTEPDEDIEPGTVVCFYNHRRDEDGFGTFLGYVEKNGRIYGRVLEVKIWAGRRYMQDGILYEPGDFYEEENDLYIENIAIADEMLNEDDPFIYVNY